MRPDHRSASPPFIGLIGLFALLAIGVGLTSSYFSDSVTLIGRYVADIPGNQVPPTPEECAGMTFSEVIVGTPGDDHIVAANGGARRFPRGRATWGCPGALVRLRRARYLDQGPVLYVAAA